MSIVSGVIVLSLLCSQLLNFSSGIVERHAHTEQPMAIVTTLGLLELWDVSVSLVCKTDRFAWNCPESSGLIW